MRRKESAWRHTHVWEVSEFLSEVRLPAVIQKLHTASHAHLDSLVGTVTRYVLHDPGFKPRYEKLIHLVYKSPDRLWGPPSRRRVARHSRPSSAEVRNEWSNNCTPSIRLHSTGTTVPQLSPVLVSFMQRGEQMQSVQSRYFWNLLVSNIHNSSTVSEKQCQIF
jgi:hypothetical protein